jgi:hypothetical protein
MVAIFGRSRSAASRIALHASLPAGISTSIKSASSRGLRSFNISSSWRYLRTISVVFGMTKVPTAHASSAAFGEMPELSQ